MAALEAAGDKLEVEEGDNSRDRDRVERDKEVYEEKGKSGLNIIGPKVCQGPLNFLATEVYWCVYTDVYPNGRFYVENFKTRWFLFRIIPKIIWD
jgi:hypothetical protein